MTIVECPWCEAPVALDTPEELRCDGCALSVAVEDGPGWEAALAA